MNDAMTPSVVPAVSADPLTATRLPAHFYLDDAILQLEQERIFSRSWLLAGHVEQLPKVGSYFLAEVAGQQVIIVRGHDDAIRAFHNVCRHRGHELLQGTGCIQRITCPYHAWTYDLDGALSHARNSHLVPKFCADDHALKSVRIEQFLGFLLLNLDPGATSFTEQFEGLEDEIRQYVPRVEELVLDEPAARNTTTLDCNWKVLLDNCVECYHCTPAHPAFVDLVNLETYRITCHEMHTTHIVDSVNTDNAAYPYEPTDEVHHAVFWHLWPNLTLGLLPGSPNFGVFSIDPITTERTRTRALSLRLPGPRTEAEIARNDYGSKVLWPEDLALCESVQRGMTSTAFEPDRFMIGDIRDGESEIATHFFQHRIAVALAGE